jgi:hypothetical protein
MFARSEQNDESEASQASPSGPPPRPGHLCSDRPNTTLPAPAGTENMEHERVKSPARVVVRLYLRCGRRL